MKKPSRKLQKLSLISYVITAAIILMILILSVVIIIQKHKLSAAIDTESRHALVSAYELNRLKFCYERDIKPCSNEAIALWNHAHQDDTLNIFPPQLSK